MTTYKIYIDLDGVLVDFNKKALEVAGVRPDDTGTDKVLRRDFWKAIDRHVKAGHKFFEAMDPMVDAMVLWDYIKHRDPTICSATGHIRGAGEEKRAWVRKHLGHSTADLGLYVRDGADKATHAAPTHILIDDRLKVLTPWIEAGGIGILHTSAVTTIEKLKEYGL